jgi:hypothetical protein
LPAQTRVTQSLATPQNLPAAHGAQLPPQSMSVSVPSFTLLVQRAPPWQIPPEQVCVMQSVLIEQILPTAHLLGQLPLQSMSVSAPFFTPSAQDGAWQVTLHTPLAQSPADPQVLPSTQRAQPPPQSASLSEPFFTPSEQVGVLHTPLAQTPL